MTTISYEICSSWEHIGNPFRKVWTTKGKDMTDLSDCKMKDMTCLDLFFNNLKELICKLKEIDEDRYIVHSHTNATNFLK